MCIIMLYYSIYGMRCERKEGNTRETKENLAEARGADNLQEEEIIAGTNQSASALLPFEVKASGTVENNESAWFAFTTGEGAKSTYKITVINTTSNSGEILGELYDEYGTRLAYGRAQGDGTACTISSNKLKENTTYYVGLKSGYFNGTHDYVISVKASEKKESAKTLVFEAPFEINETQVRFVANKAVFINEEKAKEVLKPVAEAILKYTDHSVMIAGTTAIAGTQKACVELSVKRAEAVKNLLVKTYGVPESQLKIAGLGYELDPFERGKDKKANGEFVETEACKNRRVVIMDIEDPVAQKLMKYAK